jgi:hypothetical protein
VRIEAERHQTKTHTHTHTTPYHTINEFAHLSKHKDINSMNNLPLNFCELVKSGNMIGISFIDMVIFEIFNVLDL